MSGSIQLVATGAQDIYLSGEPQITFFKSVYKRHTNFSMDTLNLTYGGTPNWGSTVDVEINNFGDLLKGITIAIKVYFRVWSGRIYRWCKAFSFFSSIDLLFGDDIIDTLHPDVLQAKVHYG